MASDQEKILVNRVANSGLKVINLETYYPKVQIDHFDLQPFLFKGLILKEKDFRQALKEYNWASHKDRIVLIYNSTDAIIPVWAYMLVSTYLSGIAEDIYQGQENEYLSNYYKETISEMDLTAYQDDRVVIKGCSNKPVPAMAYALIANRLKPYAQSIMYGEPCSTVPICKRPRKLN